LTASSSSNAVNNESVNEELKWASLQKLSTSKSATRRLDHVYNLSSNMMEKASNKMKSLNLNDVNLPLDKGFLDFIMDYLFPDAKLASASRSSQPSAQSQIGNSKNSQAFFKKINLMKSSSADNTGLLNKLVVSLSIVNLLGQTKAIAQLWKEFLLELRFRYESSILIPDLLTSVVNNDSLDLSKPNPIAPPDLSRCLLHQKIQMLNCCIKKKVERQEYELNTPLTSTKKTENEVENNDDEDEQFFDCDDEPEESVEKKENSDLQSSTPEGRLKKFGDLTLLNNPKEFIYVPITQESTPMTEDMIEQHASVLVNLGSSDDAALLRAKIQSASLLSDMQSFKAANPGCVLEDFVRWYSPRDWVETEEKRTDAETNEDKISKTFGLSNRMKIPGNVWIEAWTNSKPVPVRRQKRLFDDTKEAENVSFVWFWTEKGFLFLKLVFF
jgi:Rab3 GTPase-activating protein catalytic subunit